MSMESAFNTTTLSMLLQQWLSIVKMWKNFQISFCQNNYIENLADHMNVLLFIFHLSSHT